MSGENMGIGGAHPRFPPPGNAVMNSNAAEGYAGLLQWADPIIFDRMLEAYGAHVSDLKIVWRLARLHARVWRALFEGDLRAFETRRRELIAALEAEDLDLDSVADADARTLRELLTVVVDRFHRMPRVSMNYHLALLELAGRLSPAGAPLPLAA
jgi:hypothetical protein